MRVLRFDVFTLDLPRRALRREGKELALRPQAFDVLAFLVEHAGQVVSKKELFDAVWAGAARTDDSLVQCIMDIRNALGDDDHRIIKTVPRRGYVFMAEVATAPHVPLAPAASPPSPS
jgi:DNA-binding winged helix-turn-helix (wHTH) protein